MPRISFVKRLSALLPWSVVAGFCIMLVLLPLGCSERRVEERIRKSLAAAKSTLSRTNDAIWLDIQHDVIQALETATPTSLKSPTLCAAVIWPMEDQPSPILEFWWIEDVPSIDGVMIRWPSNPHGTFLTVSPAILSEFRNDKTTMDLVLYPLYIPLGKGQVPATHDLEVALIREGRVVSNFVKCRTKRGSS